MSGARILIVDDEPQILRFLKPSLAAAGYDVIAAATGKDALKAAATSSPDVIVLDLGLPDMDGKEVIGRIREWSDVPILILSVRQAEEEKVAALDAGANDYVTKPWVDEELVARVETQVRIAQNTRKKQRAGATDPLTEVGNLSWLLERAAAELNRAARGGWKVAVIVVDIDGLSTINEEHGREMGDRVLQHAASVLKTGFRRYDGVARTGADEFSILLPDADERVGSFVAKRVKEQIDRSEGPIPFTVSVGCAAGPADPNDDATQLLKRADDKLRGG